MICMHMLGMYVCICNDMHAHVCIVCMCIHTYTQRERDYPTSAGTLQYDENTHTYMYTHIHTHIQACYHRASTMLASKGHVTVRSADMATAIAVGDAIEVRASVYVCMYAMCMYAVCAQICYLHMRVDSVMICMYM